MKNVFVVFVELLDDEVQSYINMRLVEFPFLPNVGDTISVDAETEVEITRRSFMLSNEGTPALICECDRSRLIDILGRLEPLSILSFEIVGHSSSKNGGQS